MAAQHLATFTFLDRSNEKSSVSVYVGPITAVSLPGFLTDFGNLKTRLQFMSTGTMQQESWIGDRTVLSNDLPSDPYAQRELKFLVRYRDSVTDKKYSLTIPCANLGGVALTPGTDLAVLTLPPTSLFVTAFETIARSPDSDTNAVTIDSIQVVGRNL